MNADTNFGKLNVNNFWVDMLKNGQNYLDHESKKSDVAHKWFDKSSRLDNFCMLIAIE